MAFEKYLAEKAAYDKSHLKEMVKVVPPAQSPSINKSVLLQSIRDIPNMQDHELKNFVLRHFNALLKNVFVGYQTNEHIQLFMDPRFLDAFADVLQLQTFYDIETIVRINNICYDYLSLKMGKDKNIADRYIRIGNLINRPGMPRLLGLGLSTNLSLILLIARYSSFDLNTCVRRVNFIIITQPKPLMTQEMVTEILRVLYGEGEIWGRIFQYFMTDVIPEYSQDGWVTEDVEEINSIINLAILDILNGEPSHIIRHALINYAESYNIINNTKPKRFSMQRLSDDYARVVDIVSYLKYNEGIIVP